MPFIPHTPESLLPRSDSKNVATTCKGITDSGRPCRRGLRSSKADDGVLAVTADDVVGGDGAAAFFCWQHKGQAQNLIPESRADGATNVYSLKTRTSTDTLIERLGLLDVGNGGRRGTNKKKNTSQRPDKSGLPETWQKVSGPVLGLQDARHDEGRQPKPRRRPHPFLSFLCCGSLDEADDLHRPVNPRPKPTSNPEMATVATPSRVQQPSQAPRTQRRRHSYSSRPALAAKSTNQPSRPPLPKDPLSQTENLLTLIPKTLSPQTTAHLLAELAKPVSSHDEEGYIYMFWLTPTDSQANGLQDPSTLLSANSPLPSPRPRRPSSANPSTILLKIGRASNVQRRMNEWTRQCGHDLSLIRYYPHVPSSPMPSPSRSTSAGSPRKVPHAHRVERLIHLELAEKRVKRDCETGGKEHRE
ncbi:MAG: hypothetical protein Q9174_007203 [Haloplaca sp. 1 TL-2023]